MEGGRLKRFSPQMARSQRSEREQNFNTGQQGGRERRES